MSNRDLMDEALRLASLGYRVFPLAPMTKIPLAGSKGVHEATTDKAMIRRWWTDRPRSNIGLAMGGPHRLIAIDIDPNALRAYGAESVAELELTLTDHPRQRTPRKLWHWVARLPESAHAANVNSKLAQGLDIKTDGGYIVVAPSYVDDTAKGVRGGYEWLSPLPDDPADIPEAPAWLIEALREAAPTTSSNRSANEHALNTDEPIPEGQRHKALVSIAGHLRAVGLDEDAIGAALRKVNARRCSPPKSDRDMLKIAASVAKYEPNFDLAGDSAANVSAIADGQVTTSGVDLSAILGDAPTAGNDEIAAISVGQLTAAYPALRPPVIHGLLREGETLNCIAAPKTGKSWLTLDLAIAVATGKAWLDRDPTEPGEVLIIDNELHRETSAHRIPKVAEARGVAMREINDRLCVDNIRGRLADINRLGARLDMLEPGRFKMIVLDAFYRFMPADADENNNAAMANVYNIVDNLADRLGCCFVCIHHSTKGSQSAKSVTDVGAGAGAQSRATDTHLVLRQHEESGAVVLDAATRSWPPIEPVCLRWEFPVWSVDDGLDPALLRSEKPGKKPNKAPPKDQTPQPDPWTVERFVETFITETPQSKAQIREAAADEPGLSWRRIADLLEIAEAKRLIYRWTVGRAHKALYATVPHPEQREVEP